MVSNQTLNSRLAKIGIGSNGRTAAEVRYNDLPTVSSAPETRPFTIVNGVRHYSQPKTEAPRNVGLGGGLTEAKTSPDLSGPNPNTSTPAGNVGLGGTAPTGGNTPSTTVTADDAGPQQNTSDTNSQNNAATSWMITDYARPQDDLPPPSRPYTPAYNRRDLPNASTGGTGYNTETNVSNIAADIMAEDSRLMQLAATQGRQFANRRGLMNSSMAANAAQDAVLEQVVPMASQEAGQRFQSNRANQDYELSSLLSGQDYQQQRGLNQQNFGFETALSAQDYTQQRGLNEQNYGFQRGLNEQEYGFDTGRMRLENELSINRDNNAFANERDLEGMRIDAGREEAALDREFEREMTGIEWDGRFGLAELDGQIRMDLMDRESEMRTRITRLENELEAKGVSMDAFFTARQQYNSRVDQIMANPDLSAEERASQLETALTYLDTDIRGIEDMYNIDLAWTDYEPAPAPVDASQVRSDIENIYREVLGRDADLSGANGYEEAVLSGRMTLDDVRREIRNSQEGTGQLAAVRNNVAQLYQDILGRAPDGPGLDFWAQQVLDGNVTIDDVRANFQQEAQSGGQTAAPSDDSNLSTQDKVSALRAAYTNILGREPDAEGFNFWRDALINGRTTVAEMQAAFRAEAANQ